MEEVKVIDVQTSESRALAFPRLMRNVYLWMTLALVMTGMTAAYVAGNLNLVEAIFSSRAGLWGLIIAELALVVILSACIDRISFPVAGTLFAAYAILNGVTLSSILLVYTAESVATTFFITAGTFGAMTLVGFTVKRDLGFMGRLLLMSLFGLIIATVVNMFVASSALAWALNYLGVAIFVGLTVYDTQKIKNLMMEYGTDVNDSTMKIALLGSLTLYLDFVNMFLYLLRIFGNRR